MHKEVLHHLARRGYESMSGETGDNIMFEANGWQMLPITLSVVFLALALASVRYTVGSVVASLAMIEDTQTVVVVERRAAIVDEKEDADAPMDKKPLIDEEVMVVNQIPLTSSIRKTVNHLHSVGGYRARWRGVGVACMYNLVQSLVVGLITAFAGFSILGRVVANIAANVLCAKIHMVWTHTIISEPSSKSWYQRMPQDKKVWRALVLPSFVHSLAELATFGLPAAMFVFVGPVIEEGSQATPNMVISGIMSAVACVMLHILILLPATVTLTRVEASFLPEDENTIVPFDRTFNGAVNMLELDDRAARKSMFVEAWRSFDMSSRRRLIKLYVKEAGIELVVSAFGIMSIAAQILIL